MDHTMTMETARDAAAALASEKAGRSLTPSHMYRGARWWVAVFDGDDVPLGITYIVVPDNGERPLFRSSPMGPLFSNLR